MSIAAEFSNLPSGAGFDAAGLDNRSSRLRAGFQLDALADAMASGRLGGKQVRSADPAILVTLLDRLNWIIDARKFAGALPHFPENFGLEEVRNTLATLGYSSRVGEMRGALLGAAPPATLVVAEDNEIFLITQRPSGRLMLTRPNSDQEPVVDRKIDPKRRYKTVQFSGLEDDQRRARMAPKQTSWTGDTWRRFMPEIRLLFMLSLASGAMVILVSFAISMIFDTVVPAEATDTLLAILLGVLAIFVTDLSFRRIRAKVIGHISGRLEYMLGAALFAKLLSLPLDMLTASSVSDQLARLRQFETVRDLFGGPFAAVVLELPFVLILWVTIAIISLPLALILLLIVGLFTVVGAFLVPQIKRVSQALARARTDHTRIVLETIAHRTQIGRSGLAPVWVEKLAGATRTVARTRRQLNFSSALLTSLSTAALPMSAAMVIGCGAYLVIAGQLSGGHLVAVTILTWRLLAPVQQALLLASKAPEIIGLLKQIDTLMRLEGEEQVTDSRVERRITGSVTTEGVVFRYPKALSPAVVGLNIEVQAGQFVVITGPSGAGKTTLLRLLMGLNKPQSGSIRLGGLNVNQLSRSELANHVGYVSQTPLLFYGTVAQNLRLASPLSSDEDLTEILCELGLAKWLEDLPDGLETRLDPTRSDGAVTPGVRSMLAVAQALLRKPTILLMDEPVNGLDPDQENHLIQAIERRRTSMTCLMVTHRPSHGKRADSALLMNAGSGQMRAIKKPKGPKS